MTVNSYNITIYRNGNATWEGMGKAGFTPAVDVFLINLAFGIPSVLVERKRCVRCLFRLIVQLSCPQAYDCEMTFIIQSIRSRMDRQTLIINAVASIGKNIQKGRRP